MTCRLCGGTHRGWERCSVVHKLSINPEMVVHDEATSDTVVVHESRHGKYANVDARKAYRREWMRKKRSQP